MYQNLRFVREMTGEENYMPFYSVRTPDGQELAALEETDVAAVMDWFKSYQAQEQEADQQDAAATNLVGEQAALDF